MQMGNEIFSSIIFVQFVYGMLVLVTNVFAACNASAVFRLQPQFFLTDFIWFRPLLQSFAFSPFTSRCSRRNCLYFVLLAPWCWIEYAHIRYKCGQDFVI